MVLVFGFKKTRRRLIGGHFSAFLVFVVGHTVLLGITVVYSFRYFSSKRI
jgi:hypothetical protein